MDFFLQCIIEVTSRINCDFTTKVARCNRYKKIETNREENLQKKTITYFFGYYTFMYNYVIKTSLNICFINKIQ